MRGSREKTRIMITRWLKKLLILTFIELPGVTTAAAFRTNLCSLLTGVEFSLYFSIQIAHCPPTDVRIPRLSGETLARLGAR